MPGRRFRGVDSDRLPTGVAPPLNVNTWNIAKKLYRMLRDSRSSLNSLTDLPARLQRWSASRRMQRHSFAEQGYGRRKRLVVFFIPGISQVTGGGLQIFALHRRTRALFKETGTDALICWLPDEGWDQHRFAGFDNDVTVFPLEMVLQSCAVDCELFFHLPEYAAADFCNSIGWQRLAALRKKHRLQINILNQNIERMPGPQFVSRLQRIFPDLTATCCNPAWMSAEERERLRLPMHYLPTWYYPDDAPWQPYESKQNLMIVSHDPSPYRELVLNAIRRALPELEIRVIWGLKYEQYLELERAAKWSITFGEGLDGYFYGPVFRGGIAFAVRNGTFDVPGFEEKRSIYASYERMAEHIAADISALDAKAPYEEYNRSLRAPLQRLFSSELTSKALVAFYRGELDFPAATR